MLKQLISVTPKATQQLLSIIKKHNTQFINFTVKSGGCSGFTYVLKPCQDNVGDHDLYEDDKLQIKISKEDTFLLLGTKIDWEDEIIKGTLVCRDGSVVHPALTGQES